MRIQDSAYVVDLSRTEAVNENETGSVTSRGRQGRDSFDRIDISNCGRSFEDLKAQIDALPDVRLERVKLARRTLQAEGCNVQRAAVAEKMMKVAVIFS